jgi:DNA-binding NtrC family response regulator
MLFKSETDVSMLDTGPSAAAEPRISILLIDDDEAVLEVVALALNKAGVEILSTTSPREGLKIVRERHPQIVLLDLNMPEMSGMEVLQEILHLDAKTEVILVTADYSTESAVLAIQNGASDYWTKPFAIDALRERVSIVIKEVRRRQMQSALDHETLESFQFEGIIGRSPLILDMLTRIRRVAGHFRNVLIIGESGTWKELVANALHRLSPVRERTLVLCNCAAIVETLFESEMFGHVRGAFTGANSDKAGLFEVADGSSIFLDEIGELSLTSQAKLLRAIQYQESQRVGSAQVRKVDMRVIAATNRELTDLVREKQFRSDLYYRLSAIEIRVPPLIDRKEDIALLQSHFIQKYSAQYGRKLRGLTRRAQIVLGRHQWPGNVRELENVMAHGCMVAEGDYIDVEDLPEYLKNPNESPSSAGTELISLDELQRRHARRVLEHVNGNKVQAAQILGISRATLYRLLEAHN